MADKKSSPRVERRWSKLEENAAGGVGPGFERNPRKGTQNPLTAHLRPVEPTSDKKPAEE